MTGAPFVILALPRSRTTWLARFLTYGPWHCHHEEARHLRSLEDAAAWLAQDWTGTVETAIARWWRLIPALRPDARIVTVRRPIAECVESLVRRGFRRDRLDRPLRQLDRALNRIERRGGTLRIEFAALAEESTCAALFQHCLGLPHDHARWAGLAGVNIQCDLAALMRYSRANAAGLDAVARDATRRMRGLLGARLSAPETAPDGVTLERERLAAFWRDGQDLFRRHCIEVGEPEDQFLRKNLVLIERLERAGAWHFLTARQNGRMLGYLASLVAPSIEHRAMMIATQTLFYVDPGAAGLRLPMRLQRAAIAQFRAMGVGEVYMRAGVRGDGPRLGVLYRRLGAEPFGTFWRLVLPNNGVEMPAE